MYFPKTLGWNNQCKTLRGMGPITTVTSPPTQLFLLQISPLHHILKYLYQRPTPTIQFIRYFLTGKQWCHFNMPRCPTPHMASLQYDPTLNTGSPIPEFVSHCNIQHLFLDSAQTRPLNRLADAQSPSVANGGFLHMKSSSSFI